ncbi:MAG: alpha/beta hydrolase family protein [Neisseriaceae bacterium]
MLSKIFWILLIVCIICSCSSIKPEYVVQKTNYQVRNVPLSNLESSELVFVYNTESLEYGYEHMFCTNLIHCKSNIENVKNNPYFGGFDLSKRPIKDNLYSIESISLYRIIYTTIGQFGESELVSGAIYYPEISKNKIKGVVLFFHPTFFAKSSVSSYDPKNRVNRSIAALFASYGYIVLYPDYIGMGYNRKQVHPYVLYPKVNALDGLSILTASQQFLIRNNLLPDKHHKIPLFLTGYSEGSAYAMWFSRLYQEQANFKNVFDKTNYELRLVAPISGAYNLSNVTYNYLYSNINTFNTDVYRVSNSLVSSMLKPALLADALISYAYYSESGNYNKVFNPDFFAMNCTLSFNSGCQINKHTRNNLLNILSIESKDVNFPMVDNSLDLYIVNKIYNSAVYKINNDAIFTLWTNSALPLVSAEILNSEKLMKLMSEGDIYYWKSSIPTVLITLKRDSVVSPLNTDYAYNGMLANGSKNIDKIEIDNGLIKNKLIFGMPEFEVDHLTGLFYLFIIARDQFDNNLLSDK